MREIQLDEYQNGDVLTHKQSETNHITIQKSRFVEG